MGGAAVDDGIGIGIFRIDAERLSQACTVAGLDGGEAEAVLDVAGGDEADPAGAEHADAVVENDIVVGPRICRGHVRHLLSSVSSATSIRTIAGPVLTSAPSGSIHKSGIRTAVPSI